MHENKDGPTFDRTVGRARRARSSNSLGLLAGALLACSFSGCALEEQGHQDEKKVQVGKVSQALSPNAGIAEDQPNIYWGGRTQSAAIHPTNNQIIIAATDNGGLFRTTNGGVGSNAWQDLENLIPKEIMDVGFVPASPNIVIATALRDSRVNLTPGGTAGNAGGIWRSLDGGDTWAPATWATTPPFTTYAAYGVAFEPSTQNVYVGTDFGLAVSTDNGQTFTHVTLNGVNRWVQSVVVQNGIIDLVAQGGIHFRASTATAPTFTWTQNAIAGATLTHGWGGFAVHSIARAPSPNDNVVFVAANNGTNYSVFESDDQGATWTDLAPLPRVSPAGNRVPLVATSPAYGTGGFDIWVGDGVNMFTQQCTQRAGDCATNSANCECTPGAFTFINLRSGTRGVIPPPGPDPAVTCAKNGGPCEHNDPSQVIFDPTGGTTCPADGRPIPLLIATDGGLMRVEDMDNPSDTCGIRWETLGGGNGGFNALELYQLTGQVHGPGVDTWLYFGTQDNDLWASDTATGPTGRPWPGNMVFEGFAIDLPHFSPTGSAGMAVTAVACAACGNNYANSDFSAISSWINPPGLNRPTAVFCPDIAPMDGACDCVDANGDGTCEPNNALCTNVAGVGRRCQPNCLDNNNDGTCDGSPSNCPDNQPQDNRCDDVQVACPDVNGDGLCDCVDADGDGTCEANNSLCSTIAGQVVCQANCIDNDNTGTCDGIVCVDALPAPDLFCDTNGGRAPAHVAAPRGLSPTLHYQFSDQPTTHPITLQRQHHLYVSADAGVTWTPVPGGVVTGGIGGQTIFEGRSTTPTLFVGNGGSVASITNLPTVVPIPAAAVATVATVPTPSPFSTTGNSVRFLDGTQSVGVHPNTPTTMIAATANGLQMTTNAGADNWTVNAAGMAQLRNLVTANGTYNYSFTTVGAGTFFTSSQVRVIEFDGASQTILVGTEHAGIISSLDGGATWARVCDSDKIPRITSFFFDEGCTSAACAVPPSVVRQPQAYAGSYGRGIWTVDPAAQQIPTFTSVPAALDVNDCGPVDIGEAAGVDSCQNLPVQVVAGANADPSDPDFGCAGGARPCGDFGRGPNTVTWTASDAAGDSTTTTSTVTVTDTTPPVFDDAPETVSLTSCAGDGESFTLVPPTAIDACIGAVPVTGSVIASDSMTVPTPVNPDNTVVLSIGTHTVRWTASDGITSATLDQVIVVSPAIYANGELQIRDRVLLSTEDPNDPAGAANAGTVLTQSGDDSLTATLRSMAKVIVDGGTVQGDVISPAGITTPNNGNITGNQINAVPVLPEFPTLASVVFPSPTGGDVTVSTGSQPLAPGSYGNVTVNSGASNQPKPTLVLSAGDYYFERLTSEANSVIQLPPGGVTRIFVSVHMDYRGPFLASDGSLAEVYLGYKGTDQLTLEAPFLGILIAPNARLEMGTGNVLEFRGQFFAQTLWVRPGAHVVCLSSPELDGTPPADSCFDGVLNGSETGVDCGGTCPPCGNGTACSIGSDCQSGVCTTGVCQAPTCSDGVKNGTETGVDCGGSCSACPPACNLGTYEAETMFHSTGNSVTDGWNIFSNGYISATHDFSGPSTITVRASGSVANGGWPHMVVSVGGVPIGNVFVTSTTFTNYTFNYTGASGNREVRVTFDNDLYAPPQDRNLYVDRVEVGCTSTTPGLDAVFSAPTSNSAEGYCVNLVVTNTSSVPVTGWSVNIDTNQSTMYTSWNGLFSGTSGPVQVQPQFSFNQTIPPNATDSTIGFCATRTVSGSGTLPLVVSTTPP